MKKVLLFLIVFLFFVSFFVGCIPALDNFSTYRQAYPEYFTAVIHSIPGAYEGDTIRFIKLEEDSYGRILFAGMDNFISSPNPNSKSLCLVVIQAVNSGTVSYIEDYNYAIKEITEASALTTHLVNKVFSNDEIRSLQEQNHWNENWNGLTVVKEISRSREDPFDGDYRKKAFSEISQYYNASCDRLLTVDSRGNAIYVLREYNRNAADGSEYGKAYFMWVDTNGAVGAIEEIKDLWDYRDQLIDFKAANGWTING